VAGSPELAIANSMKNAANLGIVFTTPRSRRCRGCAAVIHDTDAEDIAPDTKPCEIICTMPPAMPTALKMKKPSGDEAMCAIDEYATASSCRLHQRDQADVDDRNQRRTMMNPDKAWDASGTIGSENRRKP